MKPCQQLHVEVAVPDPTSAYFVVHRDRLDGPRLLAPRYIPGGDIAQADFLLDVSFLDVDFIEEDPIWGVVGPGPFRTNVSLLDGPDLIEMAGSGTLPDGMVWLSLMTTMTSLSISRGVDTVQGIAARPTAGTLSAEIIDPFFDALENKEIGLTSLVRVRVDHEPIFVGNIISIATTFNAGGVPVLTFTAADGIAKLNSIPMGARPAETYEERVAAVAQATDLTHSVTGPGLPQTGTDQPRSALETLYLAQDTEAGWTMVTRTNHLVAWPRGVAETTTSPDYVLSDRHADLDHDACITAVQTGVDTSRVINNLTVRNIRWDDSDPDPSRHRWVTDSHEYSSASSTEFYGVAQHAVTTAMDDTLLHAYRDFVFDHYEKPLRHVKAVEFVTDDFTSTAVPRICLIDVGDQVAIRMNAPATGAVAINVLERVMRIDHRITPSEWITQVAVA